MDLRDYIVDSPDDDQQVYHTSTDLIGLISRAYAASTRRVTTVGGVPTCVLCRVEQRAKAA